MKVKIIQLILLVSLSLNVFHDLVIAESHKHANETLQEYILEQTTGSDCGKIGESHHMFHLLAVFINNDANLRHFSGGIKIYSDTPQHHFTLYSTTTKPPIV